MAERLMLGQLLISAEVIVEGQLAAALDEQKQTGRPLGMTLVTMGFLDEETLVRTLARQLSLPIAWIRGKKIRQPVLELVPASIVGAHRCLPVRVDDQGGQKTLLLAMEDPADVSVLDEVALAAGMPVRPVLAAPSEIEESIQRHFPDLDLEAIGASLDEELIPGLEGGTDDEEKDDACMSSLDVGEGFSEDVETAASSAGDDVSDAGEDSGYDFADLDGPLEPVDTGSDADDASLSYDDLDASNDLDLDDDLDDGLDDIDAEFTASEASEPDTLDDLATVEAETEAEAEHQALVLKPVGSPSGSGGSTVSSGASGVEAAEEGPELVCMSDASPLAQVAQASAATALGSVGADVILRALSQLLVEKGVIGREELIERLTALSGRGDEDGLSEDLDAEI